MSNHGALANLDDSAAIAELAEGAMLKQIAARYGVSKVAVYKRLSKHPEYKDAIALQAHSFVEDAMADVMSADADTVNIARARVDAAFKYARAHHPDIYGDQSKMVHEVGESFESLLQQISQSRTAGAVQQTPIIDVTPTKDT